MKKLALALLMVLCMAGVAHAGACTNGSMTKTTKYLDQNQHVVQLVLTSKSDGTLSGTANCQFELNGGYIHLVDVNPSATAAPTADYDCQLQNGLGIDLMGGALQNLPAALASDGTDATFTPLPGGSAGSHSSYGSASVVCSAMGDTKSTTMDVYIWMEN